MSFAPDLPGAVLPVAALQEPHGAYTHLLTSRSGVFLINDSRFLKVLDGKFFGVTVAAGRIYAFENCGTRPGNSGRIISFVLERDVVVDRQVMVEGLAGGCHQIDVVNESLLVVDTDNQRIVEFDRRWRRRDHYPLPRAYNGEPGYCHMNSLLGRGSSIYLMLHHNGRRPSERLEVDADFREIDRVSLPGRACHDLVLTGEGTWIMCDSLHGQLIDEQGCLVKIDELMTRGLAVSEHEVVVGSSLLDARPVRDLIPGFVTFLDRSYRRLARVHVPAAPTQIRRLEGVDYGLSTPRAWP